MKKKHKVTPKRVVAVALGALIGYLIVGYLGISLQKRPAETHSYRMDATFTYLGSAENLPIENVWILFPCPTVENKIDFQLTGTWALYWQHENEVLHLQASATENFEPNPPRTAPLQIIDHGARPTFYGPKISYILEKLYPREVFWITAWIENIKGSVTLRDFRANEGRSSGTFVKFYPQGLSQYVQLDFPIDLSFWAQLSKKIDNHYEAVETFNRSAENRTEASLWLYPS